VLGVVGGAGASLVHPGTSAGRFLFAASLGYCAASGVAALVDPQRRALWDILAGTSIVDDPYDEPAVDPPSEPYRNFMDRFEAAYRSELSAFVDAVRHGRPSACPLEEARAALLVALAADRSRSERRPVSIEEVALARATSTG
jgi:predicted dehydrogenase